MEKDGEVKLEEIEVCHTLVECHNQWTCVHV
jgi:hypothetical protein